MSHYKLKMTYLGNMHDISHLVKKVKGRPVLLVSPGPSSNFKVLSDFIDSPTVISINNAWEDCDYQFLQDDVDHVGGMRITCNERYTGKHGKEYVFVRPYKRGSKDTLWVDNKISTKYPTDSKGLGIACIAGASEVYMLGFDYGNPYGDSKRGIGLTEKEADKLDRFTGVGNVILDREPIRDYTLNHRRMEEACEWVSNVKKAKVDIYNLSPFSQIRGTKRVFEQKKRLGEYVEAD